MEKQSLETLTQGIQEAGFSVACRAGVPHPRPDEFMKEQERRGIGARRCALPAAKGGLYCWNHRLPASRLVYPRPEVFFLNLQVVPTADGLFGRLHRLHVPIFDPRDENRQEQLRLERLAQAKELRRKDAFRGRIQPDMESGIAPEPVTGQQVFGASPKGIEPEKMPRKIHIFHLLGDLERAGFIPNFACIRRARVVGRSPTLEMELRLTPADRQPLDWKAIRMEIREDSRKTIYGGGYPWCNPTGDNGETSNAFIGTAPKRAEPGTERWPLWAARFLDGGDWAMEPVR